MAFSPDSQSVALATVNGIITFARLSNLERRQNMACHSEEIPHFAWSKNGNYIVTCSHDKSCAIWNTRTRTKIQSFDLQFKGTFCGINDSNSRIVASDSHGLLYLFTKGEELPIFIGSTCPSIMSCLNYTGNGKYLIATFCDSTCKVYDETLAMVSSYSIAPTDTYAVVPVFSATCLSDSGRTVFVRVSGGKIISFSPADGRPDEEQYTGFESGDYPGDLFYRKNKKEIVTQSDDGRIVGWNLITHELKWNFELPSSNPVALSISLDGDLMGIIDMVSGSVSIYRRE